MSTASDVADATQALAAAVLAATSNPADGIRLLSQLAVFSVTTVTGSDAIGLAMNDMQTAMADLCRRAAVVALARASMTYQPSSYNDAAAVRQAVVALLDNEITVAGDQGEDATFSALCDLRVAVIDDLTTRGATLAPIITFTTGASMPDAALAVKFYRDAARADQLVAQVNPIHPLFFPTTFQALAE